MRAELEKDHFRKNDLMIQINAKKNHLKSSTWIIQIIL